MKLESSRDLPLPQQRVWEILNDPAVLQRCIPGCDTLTQEADGSMVASVVAKVGPVSAKFSGRVAFEEVVPPQSYKLVFSGQGGAAGFAKGHAVVQLEPIPSGTRLNYISEANVGGKLAQIGSRLVESSARKLADDFFSRLEAETRAEVPGEKPAASKPGADSPMVVPPAPEVIITPRTYGKDPAHASPELPGWVAWGCTAGALALLLATVALFR